MNSILRILIVGFIVGVVIGLWLAEQQRLEVEREEKGRGGTRT
jgi:hypothetical protein